MTICRWGMDSCRRWQLSIAFVGRGHCNLERGYRARGKMPSVRRILAALMGIQSSGEGGMRLKLRFGLVPSAYEDSNYG
jgi:hypothetical protein